jgi:hypothetical protein
MAIMIHRLDQSAAVILKRVTGVLTSEDTRVEGRDMEKDGRAEARDAEASTHLKAVASCAEMPADASPAIAAVEEKRVNIVPSIPVFVE